jgi:mannose-6-phosphate isomerase-like protein (cupin superfamily)
MKKYLLFEMDKYYPKGGMNDLDSTHETLDAAQKAKLPNKYGWQEIWVIEDGVITFVCKRIDVSGWGAEDK